MIFCFLTLKSWSHLWLDVMFVFSCPSDNRGSLKSTDMLEKSLLPFCVCIHSCAYVFVGTATFRRSSKARFRVTSWFQGYTWAPENLKLAGSSHISLCFGSSDFNVKLKNETNFKWNSRRRTLIYDPSRFVDVNVKHLILFVGSACLFTQLCKRQRNSS